MTAVNFWKGGPALGRVRDFLAREDFAGGLRLDLAGDFLRESMMGLSRERGAFVEKVLVQQTLHFTGSGEILQGGRRERKNGGISHRGHRGRSTEGTEKEKPRWRDEPQEGRCDRGAE